MECTEVRSGSDRDMYCQEYPGLSPLTSELCPMFAAEINVDGPIRLVI